VYIQSVIMKLFSSPTAAVAILLVVTLELILTGHASASGHNFLREQQNAPNNEYDAAGTTTTTNTFYPAIDEGLFRYTGRWQRGVARADWPCSGVHFRVNTTTATSANNAFTKSSIISLKLKLRRVRVNVVITNEATGMVESATILEGSSIWDFEESYDIELPQHQQTSDNKNNIYTVSLTKMTQASPYNNGVGKALTSVLQFHGVEIHSDTTNILSVVEPSAEQLPRRKVAMIGASDTAGFCVDGTPETSDAKGT